MAEKRVPSYQDYEEPQWQMDSARYKFAPWLIVHCRRTEQQTFTATTIVMTGFNGTAIGSFSIG